MFHRTTRSLCVAAALAVTLWTGACVEYTIDTTVHADGSGVRQETMEVGENEDVNVSEPDFLALMHASGRDGWEHSIQLDDSGDTVHVFERATRAADPAAWADLSGRVRIDGATPANARTRVGYVSLGDVQFRNVVNVGRENLSGGDISLSYRETFQWTNAFDVIVEFSLVDFDERLASLYPRLTEHARGEVVGFARAKLWSALEEGLFQSGGDDDRLLDQAAALTAPQAVKIIRVQYPEAQEAVVRNALAQALDGQDGQVEKLFERTVPGLNLAINTSIRFRLTMPGKVTGSNAQETDGSVLTWEFDPLDALAGPVEIYAESVVAG